MSTIPDSRVVPVCDACGCLLGPPPVRIIVPRWLVRNQRRTPGRRCWVCADDAEAAAVIAACAFCRRHQDAIIDAATDGGTPSYKAIIEAGTLGYSPRHYARLRREHSLAHPDHTLMTLTPRQILQRAGLR